jgi:hypothetical protein
VQVEEAVMAPNRTEAISNALRPLVWALSEERKAIGGLHVEAMYAAPEVDLIVSGHDSLFTASHQVSDQERMAQQMPISNTFSLVREIDSALE